MARNEYGLLRRSNDDLIRKLRRQETVCRYFGHDWRWESITGGTKRCRCCGALRLVKRVRSIP